MTAFAVVLAFQRGSRTKALPLEDIKPQTAPTLRFDHLEAPRCIVHRVISAEVYILSTSLGHAWPLGPYPPHRLCGHIRFGLIAATQACDNT
ncbi:MAG TPA: hypothetical protein VF637_04615, partial [Sphingomicrobium sp.]